MPGRFHWNCPWWTRLLTTDYTEIFWNIDDVFHPQNVKNLVQQEPIYLKKCVRETCDGATSRQYLDGS